MLALTFVNAEDYDKIQEDDTFDFINLESFAPKINTPLQIQITHSDGTTDTILANHNCIMNSKLDGSKLVLHLI